MKFSDLPEDVILVIFSCLNVQELGKVSSVCKQWWRLAKDQCLWKIVDLRNQERASNHSFLWREDKVNSVINNFLSRHTTDLIVQSRLSFGTLRNLSNKCPNLKQLILFACELKDNSPYVGQLRFPELKTLDWRMTTGYLAEIAHLSVECKNVENLGVGRRLTNVSSEQLFIDKFHLKVIDCHESVFITDRSLETLANNCPQLTSASFINCRNLRGIALPNLISGCPKLKTLRMRGETLQESPFLQVNWGETSLTELDLQNVHQITEATLLVMLLSLQRLRFLRCPVTDNMLAHLRSGFAELEVLKIQSSHAISQDLLAVFLCACPNLSVLDLSTQPVSSQQFATFLPCLARLKWVNIAGDNETAISVNLLQQFCPVLQVLSIQFYRGFHNSELSESLVDLIQTNPHVRKVLVSGIDIKGIIDETRLALDGRLGARTVEVIVDECFEGTEIVSPMHSLDNVLRFTFKDYRAISEKRVTGSSSTSVNRFLDQRRE